MNPYAALFLMFAVANFVAFATFELLVWRLFSFHKMAWKEAGSPTPLFADFGVLDVWRGHQAKLVLTGRWLLATPTWIRQDGSSRLLLYVHRLAFLVGVVGPVGFVIVALLLS